MEFSYGVGEGGHDILCCMCVIYVCGAGCVLIPINEWCLRLFIICVWGGEEETSINVRVWRLKWNSKQRTECTGHLRLFLLILALYTCIFF